MSLLSSPHWIEVRSHRCACRNPPFPSTFPDCPEPVLVEMIIFSIEWLQNRRVFRTIDTAHHRAVGALPVLRREMRSRDRQLKLKECSVIVCSRQQPFSAAKIGISDASLRTEMLAGQVFSIAVRTTRVGRWGSLPKGLSSSKATCSQHLFVSIMQQQTCCSCFAPHQDSNIRSILGASAT